jgi:hypothetical protein
MRGRYWVPASGEEAIAHVDHPELKLGDVDAY